jgi:hypothetical protein
MSFFVFHRCSSKLFTSITISDNTCVGAVFLLILGVLFNGLAYFASVWSAQLNAEVIEAAVAKHQSLHFRLKKGRKFLKSLILHQ